MIINLEAKSLICIIADIASLTPFSHIIGILYFLYKNIVKVNINIGKFNISIVKFNKILLISTKILLKLPKMYCLQS